MNFGESWPWLGALALAGGLAVAAPDWRAAREPAVRATALSQADLVRLGAPIDGGDARAGRGAGPGAGAFGVAGGLAALEAQVDHSGPAGGDFWSAHGVAAPDGAGEGVTSGPRLLRFRDLALPVDAALLDPAQRPEGEGPAPEDLFPPALLALDGEAVVLEGFVQPIEAKGSRITLFNLLPFPPSCLFGGMLRPDQQVEVSTAGLGGVQIHPFLPVRVEGTLSVGEELDDFGFVRSLYRLDAATVGRLQ